MLDDRGGAGDLISTLFDSSDVERLIVESINGFGLPAWPLEQLHKIGADFKGKPSKEETFLKANANSAVNNTPPEDFSEDVEEFARQFGLDKLEDPNFLEGADSKPLSTSSGPVDTQKALNNVEAINHSSSSATGCWQPFSASDAILDSVLTSAVSSSDQLLSFLEEKGINSSPIVNQRLAADQTPSTPSSSFRTISRMAFSSPPSSIGTLSFSIKAGRIMSSKREEEEKLGIFRTPSSKRRLDFLNAKPVLEDDAEIKRTKEPSRLTVGRADEGVLLMKENIDPVGIGSPPPVNTTPRSPFAEVNNNPSARPRSHSLLTQFYTANDPNFVSMEKLCKNLLPVGSVPYEQEEDPVDAEYRKFISDTLSPTSDKDETAEDDEDDEVFEVAASDLVHIKRAPSSCGQVGYRIKERELNGLIADCHQIISADSINSPFQKLEFQPSDQGFAVPAVEGGTAKQASTPEKLLTRVTLLIQIHVQLLFQQFVLCATLASGCEEAASMAKIVYSMLAELRMEGERSLTMLGRLLLPDAAPPSHLPNMLGATAIQELSGGFEAPTHYGSRFPGPSLASVFMVPGLERLAMLRPTLDKLGLVAISPPINSSCNPTLREGPRDLPSMMQVLFTLLGPTLLEQWKCLPFKSGKCRF
ncbi:hypothetical protein DI09_10p240 [Mitosporidium daphniae]|uniref:Uncharacterized protein n=1 Tax=Mitosporidium daphniae TaxID=1485682 RepID=A0A098VVZ4_9MICR|nr:uncharacterized protein DI09_10p240 [Mitosporidium daphniae]KGG53127.1 hypothetical protein DI09_10p240 [Mitosporidium daphniae]|eukprot:XP_013239554.1 uncharacterized protein DI09_10p240 [Mitosporidium daphniae]